MDNPILMPPKPFLSHREFVEKFDLVEWSYKKSEGYVEPDRKGIPRDEKRPVPKKKFTAQTNTLLIGSWTLPSMKNVAQRIESSHTLTRKWSSESDFKKAVRKLRDEYLDGFFDFFIEMLKRLHRFSQIKDRTDSDIGVEAGDFYYTMLMINLADFSWGKIVYDRARVKIKEEMPKVEVGNFICFLKLLGIICHVKLNHEFDREYLLKTRHEIDIMTHRFHHDLVVAAYRNIPITVATYSAALTTLARLMTTRFFSQLAPEKEKKKFVGPDAMLSLGTPTEYQALHLSHDV